MARVTLVLLVIVCELSIAILPALARSPARQAMTIAVTRLRDAAGREAAPLLRLPAGATLSVRGKPDNGWYRARRGRLEGYVRSGDIATDPSLPKRAGKTEETRTGPGVVAQEQRAGGRNGEWHRADKGVVEARTAADLNLRSGPSRDVAALAVIPRRSTVTLTGKHEDGFVEVSWDGQTGWALGKHLTAKRRAGKNTSKEGRQSWSRREVKAIIFQAADRYGQPREDMLRVARCESDLVPTAVNRSGGSYGLFQFKPRTWLGTPFAKYDIFDPRASAHAAAWMWSVGRRREWVCQ